MLVPSAASGAAVAVAASSAKEEAVESASGPSMDTPVLSASWSESTQVTWSTSATRSETPSQ